jgi:hypothetical protein
MQFKVNKEATETQKGTRRLPNRAGGSNRREPRPASRPILHSVGLPPWSRYPLGTKAVLDQTLTL